MGSLQCLLISLANLGYVVDKKHSILVVSR